MKKFDIFLSFVHNTDCGYMLEPPLRAHSNKYLQSMFYSKYIYKKNRYTLVYRSFTIYKCVGRGGGGGGLNGDAKYF